jgi:hypothetical protein
LRLAPGTASKGCLIFTLPPAYWPRSATGSCGIRGCSCTPRRSGFSGRHASVR